MKQAQYGAQLLILTLGLCLSVATVRAAPPIFSPHALATFDQTSRQIELPVRTVGVVTWVNPYWGSFVVADASNSQGVLVVLNDEQGQRDLQVGERVEVTGTLAVWDEHTNLKLATFKKLGSGELPAPRVAPATLNIESITELDGQLLSVEGKVSFLTQHFDRYVFWIEGYGLPVRAEFREVAKETVGLNFVGATVRITGVALQRDEEKKGRRKLMLMANSAADVEVLQPGPKWPTDEGGRGINGVLVCQKSPHRYFFRADSKEILDLEIYDNQYLTVGDMMRFVGTEVISDTGRKTVVAGLEIHSTSKDWVLGERQPQPMQTVAMRRSGDWAQLLGVTGSNLKQQLQEGWFGLTDKQGETIRVEIANLVGDINTLQLDTATDVEVVGYLDMGAAGTSIYPRDLKDLKVYQRRHWYQSALVRWLGIGILGTLTASLSGVFFLRALVHRRTRDLQESTGLLNASYDAILEGICLVDQEGAIQKANPRFWQLLNLDPKTVLGMRGEALRDHLAACFQQSAEFGRLWDGLNGDYQARQEQCFDHKSGPAEQLSVYTVAAHTQGSEKKLGRVWVFHDLTEQRRLEKSLLQAQKMEAVGRLAGGIAHDFNNMLAGISGNLEIAKIKIDQQPTESLPFVESAEYGVGRAAELVKGLLGFSRQSTLEVKPGSANEVVETLLGLLKPTLDPKLTLVADLAADLGLARIDPVKLEQVLLNLVVNARDAMPPTGGTIRIQTRNVRAAEKPDEAAAECIEITVSDTGSGMPPAVVANVFEPFFSTKQPGQGTGLGLATSLGVIQQLQGWITCESELGRGTTFRVYLPRITAVLPAQSPSRVPQAPLIKVESSLHVLCVDDETFVRQSAEAMLQAMGYQTSAAENGEEALQVLEATVAAGKNLPDVVLLDQAMPLLSGHETLPILRERYPDLPVVLCSGFLADLEEFAAQAGSHPDGFVQKPYQGQQLRLILEQVVNDRRDRPATCLP